MASGVKLPPASRGRRMTDREFSSPRVTAEVAADIQQLYAHQSHHIDSGRRRQWAETFTADGVFDSPSYPEPIRGAAALEEFVAQFHETSATHGEICRHIVDNVAITPVGDDRLTVQAYISIVATSSDGQVRVLRLTSASDEVVHEAGRWRIARRTIRRDDMV